MLKPAPLIFVFKIPSHNQIQIIEPVDCRLLQTTTPNNPHGLLWRCLSDTSCKYPSSGWKKLSQRLNSLGPCGPLSASRSNSLGPCGPL